MSDEVPRPDAPGSSAHHTDDGSLLFDPNAPEPEVGHPGSPDSRGVSPLALYAGGALVVLLIGAAITFGLRGSATPDMPETTVPTLDPVNLGAVIEALPDSMLRGRVGDTVGLIFRVIDTGNPIGDTAVSFEVRAGSSILLAESSRTDSMGVARVPLQLSDQPGRTEIIATIPDGQRREGHLTIVIDAGEAAGIRIAAGNRQTAPAGELLPERVAVIVSDAAGNPVPNAEVRFRVDTGDGLTAPSTTRTDSTGRASALWRLGRVEGRHELTAISSDVLESVTFVATAQAVGTTDEDEDRPPEAMDVLVERTTTAVGGSHVCELVSGTVSCRGNNDRGQLAANGTRQFVSLTAGASHACGLDASGRAMCWGGNERGQLGDGSRSDKAEPSSVRTELRFSELSAGAAHTCGLAGSGVPFCWGHNLNGQLGDASRNDQTAPRTVGGGLQFSTIVSGWDHTCGLTSNGNAFCWGLNSQGQLGDGSSLDQLVPTLVRGSVETLVAGSAHTCGVSEGEVLCWGANNFGQLGDGTNESRMQPVSVTGLPGRPTRLAAGAVHTCALLQDGRVYCWGQNLQGQVGDGSTQNRSSPVQVSGNLRFEQIYAGGALSCGIATDGQAYCWGLNQSGQLGDGTRVSRSSPTRVAR